MEKKLKATILFKVRVEGLMVVSREHQILFFSLAFLRGISGFL